MSLCVRKEAT